MALISDVPAWTVPHGTKCQADGCEAEAIAMWSGVNSEESRGQLRLCESCLKSICGGLLMDLIMSGRMTLHDVWEDLRERLIRVAETRGQPAPVIADTPSVKCACGRAECEGRIPVPRPTSRLDILREDS
jgi:hypothetical protein